MMAVLTALLALGSLCLLGGALLGFASVRLRVEGNPLAEQINALLPQTQCGQCGHPGCKPYAEAIVAGEAINCCPPGGTSTLKALAELLQLDTEQFSVPASASGPQVAVIREQDCVGCAKCYEACPVDAILGAPRFMHTVLQDECTGCGLCIPPCPVDCIEMQPLATSRPPATTAATTAHPCIRCGDCIPVCPSRLLPHQLHLAAQQNHSSSLEQLRLQDCIECKACERACPSQIPLVSAFRMAKHQQKEQQQQRQKAQQARQRFEQRQARLQRLALQEQQERATRTHQPALAALSQSNNLSADYKKRKAAANMALGALAKAEKQLSLRPSPALEAQVAKLRHAAEAAKSALEEIASQISPEDDPLTAAKQELVKQRTALKAAEKAQQTEEQCQPLRQAVASAEVALEAAEEATDRPLPQRIRYEKHPVDPEWRRLKTELAYARAGVQRLERHPAASSEQIQAARQRLMEAEQAADQYQQCHTTAESSAPNP